MIHAAIFASGEGTNVENLIRHFKNDSRIKIKIVITNRDDAGVIKRAEAHKKTVQIISKQALNEYTSQIIDFLNTEKIDLIILAGFLLKIPLALIQAFPNKIINIHPSLLPKHGGKGMYGIHVHRAVIENKEQESGITVHYVDAEYDKGPVILQEKIALSIDETPETLEQKIHTLEYQYYPLAVEKLLREV